MEELIKILEDLKDGSEEIWNCTIVVHRDGDVYVVGGSEGNITCEHLY